VRFARYCDLPDDTQGYCDWVLQKLQAVIRIISPDDYPFDASFPQDIEKTLVHELLHLMFAPFDVGCDTSEYVAQHQAIELLSRALVKLKREKGCK